MKISICLLLLLLVGCHSDYRNDLIQCLTDGDKKIWKSYSYSEKGILQNNGIGFSMQFNGKSKFYYTPNDSPMTVRVLLDDSEVVNTWNLICDSIIVFDGQIYSKIDRYTDTEIVLYELNRDEFSGLRIWRKEADQSTSISPHIYNPSDTFRM